MPTERIRKITMQSFRGVSGSLNIDFGDGGSAVFFGDNATGKSTIADALELFFTSRVELLAHEGREHAVRHLNAPQESVTQVLVETTGDLGGEFNFPAHSGRAPLVADHETFLLRGRTLANFVDKTKSEKWRALADILGLEEVDQGRLDLQRVRNELRATSNSNDESLGNAREALGYPRTADPPREALFEAIAQKCLDVGIVAPASFEEAVSPQWSSTIAGSGAEQRDIEVGRLLGRLEEIASSEHTIVPTAKQWNEALNETPRASIVNLQLHDAGHRFLGIVPEVTECPLCGATTQHEILSDRVTRNLDRLRIVNAAFTQARTTLQAEVESLQGRAILRNSLRDRAAELQVQVAECPTSITSTIRTAINENDEVNLTVCGDFFQEISAWDRQAADALIKVRESLDTSRDRTLVDLGELITRVKTWISAANASAKAQRALEVSNMVFTAYQERQRIMVAAVLNRISSEVAAIYEFLHPDEQLSGVSVETWTDKGLELAVDFHGVHQRPPHGVLSESHLNSLAIALFLAMAKTFNRSLAFSFWMMS